MRIWMKTPAPVPAFTNLHNSEQLVLRSKRPEDMYSLYHRSWTRNEECDETVVIAAGVGDERREFTGRRSLLASHSGYIKSLLDSSPQNHVVSIPSINPHIFATVLSYIETGFLDLNPENIYSVLLATHLLHMPRAVEICRSYLLEERKNLIPVQNPTIVKPIPSRKYIPLYWAPPFFPTPLPPYQHQLAFGPPIVTPTLSAPSTSVETEPAVNIEIPTGQDRDSSSGDSPSSEAVSIKSSKGVLKDIACCDGPVRFKRVLNVNYGISDDKKDENGSKGQTENKRVFVCEFCNHSFKSHYCYRKHTRRHLNPVPLSTVTKEKVSKDMNVQYYPCKTCGSKFPSYYFVHKHRKLCHANESLLREKLSTVPHNFQNKEPATEQ